MIFPNKDVYLAAGQILAMAVCDLFPKTQIVQTFSTKIGFGVECIPQTVIDESALALIEERMRIFLKKNLLIEPIEMVSQNAAELFLHLSQKKLAEKVSKLEETVVSLVRIGNFYGLSALSGPLETSSLGIPKLVEFSKDEGVLRIEGVVRADRKELKNFLTQYQAYKQFAHRKLGAELGLFFQTDEGDWIWPPNGESIRNTLISWWRNQLLCYGYRFFFTRLSKPTSHLSDFFVERDKIATITDVYSEEINCSGQGLLELPLYTHDQAWSLCKWERAEEELNSCLQFIEKSIKIFAIDYRWYLVASVPDGKENQRFGYIGSQLLAKILEKRGVDFSEESAIHYRRSPRIEVRLIDSLGREWVGPSIEVTPLQEAGSHGNREKVVITHSFFGSLERFAALVVERFAGDLPLWLAPEQVRVISVKGDQRAYAEEVFSTLLEHGVRAELDTSDDVLAAKIYAVKRAKIPYAVVVGKEEQQNGTIAVCSREVEDKRQQKKLGSFVEEILVELKEKTLPKF